MSGGRTTIHVMSFNTCGLPSPLAPLPERAAEFCRQIEASDVDVVNFQEVWFRRQLQVIAPLLPSFPHVAWRRTWGLVAGGLVTFSRVPVRAVAYRSFRGIIPPAGGPRFRAKRAVNGANQGVLTLELPDLGTVIANTHLTANHDGDWSATNRYHVFQRSQLERLHTVLRRVTRGLTIVTGDFNISSDSPLYPVIVDGGAWRDPFQAENPTTYQVEFLPPGSVAHRIDYVLVSGDPARHPIVHSAPMFVEPHGPDRMYLSDHVALTAQVGLARRGG